ncbi:hypothetical protein [Aeoliella mucimassa]|uniref:hypothetical protein n=1 Tax=Aeoliella mucimassa TaxID=2527972 RepID=UPI00119F6174|nr:hypothetical protein [Aeoliella mucimassa]
MFAGAARAQTVFNFDDGTLQGWTNNLPDGASGEDFATWNSALDTNGGRTVAYSGNYLVLEGDYGNRDASDINVKVLSSPIIDLQNSFGVSVWTLGGTGAVDTPTWSNYDSLPTVAGEDFMGIALRRVSDGEYLLFDNRSASGQSDRSVNWLELGWDASTVRDATASDSPNETYQIDLIDTYSGGWGWIAMDEATITELAGPTLQISRLDGTVRLVNGTEPTQMLAYDLYSPAGAFNTSGWTPIAGNYDAQPAGNGSVDVDNTWTITSGTPINLAEAEFDPNGGVGAPLAAGQPVVLGAAWTPSPYEDVEADILLADGTILPVIVEYIDGVALEFGDLTGDGNISSADWSAFKQQQFSSLDGLSLVQAYQAADLNFNGVHDLGDFAQFRQIYDQANGAGAFEALAASSKSVPEPAAWLLVCCGCAVSAAFSRKARRLFYCLTLVFVCRAGRSYADDVRFGFDDGSLQGWTMTMSSSTGSGAANFAAWDTSADTNGGRTVAASPYHMVVSVTDGGSFLDARDNAHDTLVVTSPQFGISGSSSISLQLLGGVGGDDGIPANLGSLQSSATESGFMGVALRRTSDNAYLLTGSRVSNGQSNNSGWQGVNWDAAAIAAATSGDSPNETYVIDLVDTFVGGWGWITMDSVEVNNSNFVLDDTKVFGINVDTTTGSITLFNNSSAAVAITGYEILSSAESLDADAWFSFADNPALPTGGGDGNGWEENPTSGAGQLTEWYLGDGTGAGAEYVLAAGQSIGIGNAYDTTVDVHDLQFSFSTADGLVFAASVFYDGVLPEQPKLLGDYNGDGIVNLADYTVWRDNLGSTTVLAADGNGNDVIDAGDYTVWKGNFGKLNNSPVQGSVANQAVPEPAAWGILLVAGAAVLVINRKRGIKAPRLAVLILVGLLVAARAVSASELDRHYKFGDDGQEKASVNITAGSGIGNVTSGSTLDSIGPSGAYLDLKVQGNPSYIDVSVTSSGLSQVRPAATSDSLGIRFDGTGDFLYTSSLNAPSNSLSDSSMGGPLDYSGITNRGMQLWIYPDSSNTNSWQDVVLDSNQHGIRISDEGTWVMRYNGTDVDSGVSVDFDNWSHVMVVRPYGSSGSDSGSRMYVNGVAVAARPGGYDSDDPTVLTVGASTADGFDTVIGQENQFVGVLDDLQMFVLGESINSQRDYGQFDLLSDNAFAVELSISGLTGIAGDVNQDSVVDQQDVAALVAGYRSVNVVDGIVVGDITTLTHGDLNLDGRVYLDDVFILHQALLDSGAAGFDFGLLGDSTSVPEPTGIAILTLLAGSICLSRSVKGRRNSLSQYCESHDI